MNDTPLANFGVAGVGVMGAALALNIVDHGFRVAVWNHAPARTRWLTAENPTKQLIPAETLQQFVASIERPRRILLMIKAGDVVDEMLDRLQPLLAAGDVIIDGGNSFFRDTQRRERRMRGAGIDFVGAGVSGGEKGARTGPSIMPGGTPSAWDKVRPVFEAIAARSSSGPCVAYVGPDGAGHFVKMVHNGIEYGDMQTLAEAYDLMRKAAGLDAAAIADVFAGWNQGILESFLVELSSVVLRKKDTDTGRPLVDLIVDAAGQKGTGRWTAQSALELGVPIPTISASTEARAVSSQRDQRLHAASRLEGPQPRLANEQVPKFLMDLEAAVTCSRLCSYAQGMALIRTASIDYKWDIQLSEVARIWKGGCIIRAQLLDPMRLAFERDKELSNLLLAPELALMIAERHEAWRRVMGAAVRCGIPTPSMSASLSWYDAIRSTNLPQNLIQAQRDAFGAHTYERLDKPELGFIHSDWEQ